MSVVFRFHPKGYLSKFLVDKKCKISENKSIVSIEKQGYQPEPLSPEEIIKTQEERINWIQKAQTEGGEWCIDYKDEDGNVVRTVSKSEEIGIGEIVGLTPEPRFRPPLHVVERARREMEQDLRSKEIVEEGNLKETFGQWLREEQSIQTLTDEDLESFNTALGELVESLGFTSLVDIGEYPFTAERKFADIRTLSADEIREQWQARIEESKKEERQYVFAHNPLSGPGAPTCQLYFEQDGSLRGKDWTKIHLSTGYFIETENDRITSLFEPMLDNWNELLYLSGELSTRLSESETARPSSRSASLDLLGGRRTYGVKAYYTEKDYLVEPRDRDSGKIREKVKMADLLQDFIRCRTVVGIADLVYEASGKETIIGNFELFPGARQEIQKRQSLTVEDIPFEELVRYQEKYVSYFEGVDQLVALSNPREIYDKLHELTKPRIETRAGYR